jgi:RimJ/RimL family protein N-acetyltransferase
MSNYKVLNNQLFSKNEYTIVPIRFEDRFDIMKWRNEQIYHLRQNKLLNIEDQDDYFNNRISQLFIQDLPNQILFSFLKNNVCVGYGGLVHINWIDKNAEISFLINTELEKNNFNNFWAAYLNLIEQVAFEEINMHKIFTYAFDLRPHLYPVLESCGFIEEARLKEHCLVNGKFLDVIYHAKMNKTISFRKATENDMMLYFNWTNDTSVRENSYQSETISLENHRNWFYKKIKEDNCFMVVFENHIGSPIGQVRIQKQDEKTAIIGVSNDANHRGKGYAYQMIKLASEQFLKENQMVCISAYIKIENTASEKAFLKAGYKLDELLVYNSHSSYHYTKKYENR